MTDLSEFRAALRAPDPHQRPLDIAAIMVAGARVRRRRRITASAGSGIALLVLIVAGSQLLRIAQARPPTIESAPQAAAPPAAPGPLNTGTHTAAAPRIQNLLGDIIRTGIKAGDGEWIIYLTRIDSPHLPDTTMGISTGRLLPSGAVAGSYSSNETQGSDRAPGFHAVSGSQDVGGEQLPAFGYYVGSPATITGRAGGRAVTARTAVWSEDPSVVVFWFDPTSVDPGRKLTLLAAFDRQGGKLPAGRATVGYR